MKIFTTIITNVLTALYQPFWFSVILSVLFMFVYKAYPSIKHAAKDWISWFKSDPQFILRVRYQKMEIKRRKAK